jgi:hypothetical protein
LFPHIQKIGPPKANVPRPLAATRLCTKHGHEIEKYGGDFTLSASQERTSKQGSLKLNYGGITTKSTRNEKALNRLLDEYEGQQMDSLEVVRSAYARAVVELSQRPT